MSTNANAQPFPRRMRQGQIQARRAELWEHLEKHHGDVADVLNTFHEAFDSRLVRIDFHPREDQP